MKCSFELGIARSMEFSCAIRSNLPPNRLCALRLSQKQTKSSSLVISSKQRGGYSVHCVKSVLNTREWSVYGNGTSTESARIVFERMFAQTKKLERQTSTDSHDVPLETLQSDLRVAFVTMKRRKIDLQEAKRAVLIEDGEVARAKQELEQKEKIIAAASSRQEKLQEELKQANKYFDSQSRQIEDLNFRLKAKDRVITKKRSALTSKEDELEKMIVELMLKRDEGFKILDLMENKAQLVKEAQGVVLSQEIELEMLCKEIIEKEKEIEINMVVRERGEEKLKVVEVNLGKITKEWLLANEELKNWEGASGKEVVETLEGFQRWKSHLVDLRAELLSTRRSLLFSQQKMEERKQLLEKQLAQLEEEKKGVESYTTTLNGSRLKIENEKLKLKLAETRNKERELEQETLKGQIEELQKKCQHERESLQQAMGEMSSLQNEIEKKNTKFYKARDPLKVIESKLVAADLEIQQLKSEYASLRLTLEEKHRELFRVTNKLQGVTGEIIELQILISGIEEQLVQEAAKLKDKNRYVETIQDDSIDSKSSEAEEVVERIVDLTNNLVISAEDVNLNEVKPVYGIDHKFMTNQFQTKIKSLKIELLAKQRALDARDKEIATLKEGTGQDIKDLTRIYDSVHKRIGENTIGDLVTDKLKLQVAHLDTEIARAAIQKLSETTLELLNKARLSMNLEADTDYLINVKKEVALFSALSDQLVKDAEMIDTK